MDDVNPRFQARFSQLSKAIHFLRHMLKRRAEPSDDGMHLLVTAVQVFPVDDAFMVEDAVAQLPYVLL